MEPKLAKKLHMIMANTEWHFMEDYLNERAANCFAKFINETDGNKMFSLQGEAKAYYSLINLPETIRLSLENE